MRGGSARLTAASSTDADVEQGGVEGLEWLFAPLVSLLDVGRQLNECLLVTLESRHYVLFVLFQKQMGVIANQRRLLEPRQCAKVENLHRRLDVGHLRSRTNLASQECWVEQIRAYSANLTMKPGHCEHNLRDQIDDLLRSVQRPQAKGGRQGDDPLPPGAHGGILGYAYAGEENAEVVLGVGLQDLIERQAIGRVRKRVAERFDALGRHGPRKRLESHGFDAPQ
jgi:hypothetical protein